MSCDALGELVVPRVVDDSGEDVEVELYELHKNDLDSTVKLEAKFTKEQWNGLTRSLDDLKAYTMDLESRPESSWVQVDMACTPPVNTEEVSFDATTEPNSMGFHLFRMRAVLTSWEPKSIIEYVHEPENIPMYSILNWANSVLHENKETGVRLTYNTAMGFDSHLEDVIMAAVKFQTPDGAYVSAMTTIEHPACPERKHYTRVRGLLCYFYSFKGGDGRTQLHFGVERNQQVLSYNQAVPPMMLPLQSVLFYRFFLEFCGAGLETQNVESHVASRRVVRHLVRSAVYIPLWNLVSAHPNVQMWTSRCSFTGEKKLALKAMVMFDAPINCVMDILLNHPQTWLPKGATATRIRNDGPTRAYFDIFLPKMFSEFNTEMRARVSVSSHELTSCNFIVAFTSVLPPEIEKEDGALWVIFEPSGMFIHALSTEKSFMNLVMVLNMSSVFNARTGMQHAMSDKVTGAVRNELEIFGGAVCNTFKSLADAAARYVANNTVRGPDISGDEVKAVWDAVLKQQQHIALLIEAQEKEMRELRSLIENVASRQTKDTIAELAESSVASVMAAPDSNGKDRTKKREQTNLDTPPPRSARIESAESGEGHSSKKKRS